MHASLRQAGFTLVEMMVVIVITGMISTAMYQMLQAGQATYEQNKTMVDMQQNARVGLQSLADDLRLVSYGKDPTQPSIFYAGPESVAFVADILPDEPGAEVISYFLSPDGDPDTDNPYDTVLMRVVADTSGNTLVSSTQSYGMSSYGLQFRWFNGSGVELSNPVPSPEQVGEVYIEITAAAANAIDGAYPEMSLSTTIYPRNLPLSPARSRPNTPACTGPSFPTCDSATLNWTAPTNNTDGTELPMSEISHFNFYFGTDPDDLSLYTRLARTITEWTVPDLQSGIPYYIAVSCVSRSGVESYTCQRNATLSSALVPEAPQNLIASIGTGVTLDWNAVTLFTNGDTIGTEVVYQIHRSSVDGFTPDATTLIDEVSYTTTWFDTETDGLGCGLYYYVVVAKACGNESIPSNQDDAQLPAIPACVTNIAASNGASEGEVYLSWTLPTTRTDGSPLSPGDIEYVRLYADTASGMPNDFYTTLTGAQTSVTVPYLASCATYYFNLTAIDACGHTGELCPGEEVSLFTSAPCDAEPPQPPAYVAVTEHDDYIDLEWPANSVDCDLGGYRIYYGSTPGGPYNGSDAAEGPSPIEISSDLVTYGNLCRYQLTGLGVCQEYYVKVTSIDECVPANESIGSSGEEMGQTSCVSCQIDANCVSWAVDGASNNIVHLELHANGANELLSQLQPSWSGAQALEEVWFGRPLTKIWDYDGSAGENGWYGGPANSGDPLDLSDVYVGSWTTTEDGEPFALVFDSDVRDVPLDIEFSGTAGTCSATGAGTGTISYSDFDAGMSGWTSQSGNWFVSEGELRQSYTGSNYYVQANTASQTDFTIEAKVLASGGTYHSSYIYVRYANDNNHYLAGIRTDANKVRVARIQSGSFIETGAYYTTLSDNTWYTMRVVVTGNRIRVYFDCELVIDVTDGSMLSSGQVGFVTRRASGRFDDVRIFQGEVLP
ncbi:MAG: family 16 glycoside hydrolase [Candidatus Eisenbacteria bacterium]